MNFNSFYASSTRPVEIIRSGVYENDYIYTVERVGGEMGSDLVGFYTREGNYVTSSKSTVDFIIANEIKLCCDARLFRPDVASIGYSEKEHAWYGITSFGASFASKFTIGDIVVKGMPGYAPANESEYVENVLGTLNLSGKITVNVCSVGGVRGVQVQADDFDRFFPMPEIFGSGEWTAETIDDAKKMAIDYVNGMYAEFSLDALNRMAKQSS